jgi:hypothetical protein
LKNYSLIIGETIIVVLINQAFIKFRKVVISMARKDSKNYNFTTQQQIIIKKNDDARLPKRLGSEEKIQAASEGSKIQ